jgi:hypothetical protein
VKSPRPSRTPAPSPSPVQYIAPTPPSTERAAGIEPLVAPRRPAAADPPPWFLIAALVAGLTVVSGVKLSRNGDLWTIEGSVQLTEALMAATVVVIAALLTTAFVATTV